jgi:hypothetical protein
MDNLTMHPFSSEALALSLRQLHLPFQRDKAVGCMALCGAEELSAVTTLCASLQVLLLVLASTVLVLVLYHNCATSDCWLVWTRC